MRKVSSSLYTIAALILASGMSPSASAQSTSGAMRDISGAEVSERHLVEAVASRTLTWLTGSSSNNDYISVGRTANFFGFVALRVSSNHSLTRNKVAQDTLAILSDAQRDALIALLDSQKAAFAASQQARFQMNRALEGLLVGEEISEAEFLRLGQTYGAAEAELGRVIGQTLGNVSQTLSADQKDALADIRAAHLSGRGADIDSPRARIRLAKADKQELVNLAARFLSWTTGSPEFNDFEVVGKPSQHFGFVSLRIASNHGVRRGQVAKEVLDLLSPQQTALLHAAAAHDVDRFRDFLVARGALMRTLEGALTGGTIDQAQVAKQGAVVGKIEAIMTWSQAQAMLGVRNTMTDAQSSALLAMRAKYTGAESAALPEDPVARGRQLFAQCALCHVSSEGQAIAPDLTGILGKAIASDPSYTAYSPALRDFAATEGHWNDERLDAFLASPKSTVPGTIMGFDGLDAAKDRRAIIAFLRADGG